MKSYLHNDIVITNLNNFLPNLAKKMSVSPRDHQPSSKKKHHLKVNALFTMSNDPSSTFSYNKQTMSQPPRNTMISNSGEFKLQRPQIKSRIKVRDTDNITVLNGKSPQLSHRHHQQESLHIPSTHENPIQLVMKTLKYENDVLTTQNKNLQHQIEQHMLKEQDNSLLRQLVDEQQTQITHLKQQLLQDDSSLTEQLAALQLKFQVQSNQLSSAQFALQTATREKTRLKTQLDQLQQQSSKHVVYDISQQVESMQVSKLELQRILICKYCNKPLIKSVTIIPCGHSYCYDCKKGYHNTCFICGPKKDIDAVYLNVFMDEIVKMYQHFADCLVILQEAHQVPRLTII